MPALMGDRHHRTRTLGYRSILGLILILASLLFLFLPLLAQLTFHTILALGALFFGLLLIAFECWAHAQVMKKYMKRELISKSRTLVLDDVLRDIFSMDGGILGCIIGTVGLYSLPIFTKEQRVRIIRATCPPEMNVQTLLFSPGGISAFLPDYMRRLLLDDTGSHRIDEEKMLSLHDSNIIDIGEQGGGGGGENDENDLSWDPTTDESNDSTFSLSDDGTTDGVRGTNAIANPSYQSNDPSRNHGSDCLIEAPSHRKKSDPLDDLYIMLLEQLSQTFDPISSNQLIVTGIGAAIACTLQLKRHPSNRRYAINFLHGSFFAVTTGTVFGAFGILGAKMLLSTSLKRRKCSTGVPSKQHVFLNSLSVIIDRMKTDAKFRKRWQAVLVFSMLALVGRKRRKHTPLMTSY